MIAALALALIVVALAVLVAWPYVRPARAEDRLDALSEAERRRVALLEERDLALSALRELEVDHATHQIDDRDYADLVADYRARAAAALRALDEETGHAAPAETTPAGADPSR